MSLAASPKKPRKERKRQARRAAEADAKAPPPSTEEAATASQRQCADPGSGEATATAGGDLGSPNRGGGQGALQGATEQAGSHYRPRHS
ncbi:hypothetical protein N7530_002902 [Penicillium desertorum]|uniref:Uncharacterized protein n=1 Tax=Penicillium desertorum TaxID=1303715 RepID=A0A9X0BTL7_9EURO|nr:hypothetical protein N7530_002902 [Penicillium desertorum]